MILKKMVKRLKKKVKKKEYKMREIGKILSRPKAYLMDIYCP